MGAKGHIIEECDAFQRNMLNLLDMCYISMGTQINLNIITNPLSTQNQGGKIGAIDNDFDFQRM